MPNARSGRMTATIGNGGGTFNIQHRRSSFSCIAGCQPAERGNCNGDRTANAFVAKIRAKIFRTLLGLYALCRPAACDTAGWQPALRGRGLHTMSRAAFELAFKPKGSIFSWSDR